VRLDEKDLEWKAVRSSGPGGQNTNKVNSAIQLKYIPTGIQVHIQTERSQLHNLRIAKTILAARLQEAKTTAVQGARNGVRKAQLGSGMRGDKVRSIALQRDQVTDHRLGRRTSAAKYMKGDLTDLLG
jgi:peptide chain release factor 1